MKLALMFLFVLSAPAPTISVTNWEDGVCITARIPSDTRNRLISTTWQGLDSQAAGGSIRELQGEDSPSVLSTYVRTLPNGRYLAVVTLFNAEGKRLARVSKEFLR